MRAFVAGWTTPPGRSSPGAHRGKGLRTSEKPGRWTVTYDSVHDLVDSIENRPECFERDDEIAADPDWHGGVRSTEEAIRHARKGLADRVPDAMSIAESAVSTAEAQAELPAFTSFYDVSGSDVDVARFLAGEPENMVNYQMVMTPRVGRIITLVASISASASIQADTMWNRGVQTVALILALEKIGFQVELWTDMTASSGMHEGTQGCIRTRVKGPGQLLDVSQIMFAFAHPANFRVLHFAGMHLFPKPLQRELGVGSHYGYPADPVEEMYPEGAIVLPSLKGWREAKESLVTDTLRELGIIE